MCSCVEVHETIELSLGVVSGASLGIRVLGGVHVPQGKGGFLGRGFGPIDLKGIFFNRNGE